MYSFYLFPVLLCAERDQVDLVGRRGEPLGQSFVRSLTSADRKSRRHPDDVRRLQRRLRKRIDPERVLLVAEEENANRR